MRACLKVSFGLYDEDDREGSVKRENFTARVLTQRFPTSSGEWLDRDQHNDEHVQTIYVPDEFKGQNVCILVEVVS